MTRTPQIRFQTWRFSTMPPAGGAVRWEEGKKPSRHRGAKAELQADSKDPYSRQDREQHPTSRTESRPRPPSRTADLRCRPPHPGRALGTARRLLPGSGWRQRGRRIHAAWSPSAQASRPRPRPRTPGTARRDPATRPRRTRRARALRAPRADPQRRRRRPGSRAPRRVPCSRRPRPP